MALGIDVCAAVGYISPGGAVVPPDRRHDEQDAGNTAACAQYLRDLISSVSVSIVVVVWWDGSRVYSGGLAAVDQVLVERGGADLKAAEGGD